MKLSKEYCLCTLAGADYLLPVGQGIADFKRGMKLNETSLFLLRLLQEEQEFSSIVTAFCTHYKIPEEEKTSVARDLSEVLMQLRRCGCIEEERMIWPGPSGAMMRFQIGPCTVGIQGAEELISDELMAFSISAPSTLKDSVSGDSVSSSPDQVITLIGMAPHTRPNGEILLRNEELLLMECREAYILIPLSIPQIYELHIRKDAENVICYYRPGLEEDLPELKDGIFHILRFAFLFLAGKYDAYAVHSASIVYRDKVWLFSASSGTGKSTHVNLWQELCGVPVFNGDLNLIGMKDGQPVVYGIPWCGTSGIYTNRTMPLGGITFLRQDRQDIIEEPEPDEAVLLLLNRIVYPVWTKETLCRAAVSAEQIAAVVKMHKLRCTKTLNAAKTVKEKIDRGIQSL